MVADKRVYCHEALALHAKLQDAGFRPEAEPSWDEASDSLTQMRVMRLMRLMCDELTRLMV